MINTTLCYIKKDDKYLMLHRIKKQNDINKDKWIGIGGKFEENESPDECLLREVYEETGLTLTAYKLCGIITFVSNEYEGEYMYLYTATGFTGDLIECDEGDLEWIPKDKVLKLPTWEGDMHFLTALSENRAFFTMKLRYEGDHLAEWSMREEKYNK